MPLMTENCRSTENAINEPKNHINNQIKLLIKRANKLPKNSRQIQKLPNTAKKCPKNDKQILLWHSHPQGVDSDWVLPWAGGSAPGPGGHGQEAQPGVPAVWVSAPARNRRTRHP